MKVKGRLLTNLLSTTYHTLDVSLWKDASYSGIV